MSNLTKIRHDVPILSLDKTKEIDKSFGPKLQKAIIQSINADEETEFLKDSPELHELIKEIDIEQK